MSADVVACPHCGTNLQNSAAIAGQVVACPHCRTQLRMPALSQAAAVPQFPSALPPAIEDSLPVRIGADAGPAPPIPGPIVQSKRLQGEASSRVARRPRKRSNPWAIAFIAVMIIVVVAVGTASYLSRRAEAAKRRFENQLTGNWELVPGQSQLEHWDFAFHRDGQLQMALGSQLSEGRWSVTSVSGLTANVLIEWSDDAPETMRVRLESGTMQISHASGNFAFRSAAR